MLRCSGFLLTLLALLALTACASDGAPGGGDSSLGRGASAPAVVDRVVDGDTLVALLGGESVRVRLLGIDTPESVVRNEAPECFGPESADRLRQLLPDGASVDLVTDPRGEVRDRFDRLLAYVDRDGRSINEELVRSGHAEVFAFRGRRFQRRDAFEAAERGARREARGLWGACTGAAARPAPEPQAVAPPTTGADCPAARPIKGNLPSGIYHQPGDPSYDATKPERCFASPEEAQAAGFRAPRGP